MLAPGVDDLGDPEKHNKFVIASAAKQSVSPWLLLEEKLSRSLATRLMRWKAESHILLEIFHLIRLAIASAPSPPRGRQENKCAYGRALPPGGNSMRAAEVVSPYTGSNNLFLSFFAAFKNVSTKFNLYRQC